MTGKISYLRVITRDMVRDFPDARFVFGDNLARSGMGGQALAMRGAPNAIGIATKKYPDMEAAAFFSDADLSVLKIIDADIDKVAAALAEGRLVYAPKDGLGTGLAQLPTRAPLIYRHIVDRFCGMSPNCPWSAP